MCKLACAPQYLAHGKNLYLFLMPVLFKANSKRLSRSIVLMLLLTSAVRHIYFDWFLSTLKQRRNKTKNVNQFSPTLKECSWNVCTLSHFISILIVPAIITSRRNNLNPSHVTHTYKPFWLRIHKTERIKQNKMKSNKQTNKQYTNKIDNQMRRWISLSAALCSFFFLSKSPKLQCLARNLQVFEVFKKMPKLIDRIGMCARIYTRIGKKDTQKKRRRR